MIKQAPHSHEHSCCCCEENNNKHNNCCEHEEHHNCYSHEHEEHGCGCSHCHSDESPKKTLICIIISVMLFIVGFFVKNTIANLIIYILSYIIVAHEIVINAIKNLFKGHLFDENTLMTIASIGAFAIGNRPEAVAVILFYQVGELLQDMAVDKSRDSITKLMDIRPDYANVIRAGNTIQISPADVKIGETIIVNPGERIPLDGEIVKGSAYIDTKALTGENIPQKISEGNKILSGSINNDSPIWIKVEKEFKESTVSKILDMVQYAQSQKAHSEKFITKFARYYTPIVVGLAVLVMLIPSIITHDFRTWIYRGLLFLVVSCPCALVVSVPLSFFTGIGCSSKNGILVKGSNYLEALSNMDSIVFDKTGTLTKGEFKVVDIQSSIAKNDFLKYAAHCEYYSSHPIAISIKSAFEGDIDENDIKNYKEISGKGISAEICGKEILLGNKSLISNVIESDHNGTVIYMTIDGEYVGYITIDDVIKSDSESAIKSLNNIGINTVMLTGDNNTSAEYIGKKLGIKTIYSQLLPQDKVKKLENVIKNKKAKSSVAFVGDGINDAPVLARADIGIAMGGIGSDSAIEAADVVLMTDEPSKILTAIKISKRTMQIVRQNIVFAISVKILIMILSTLGLTNMWIAIFGDVGVALLAIFNSLRAMKI